MSWQLADSLSYLIKQINEAYPHRDKSWDGTVGDEAHAARKSDHNPNERGIVCAIDITHDPKNGPDGFALAEALRLSRDRRIHYVIWNRRIFNSTTTPSWAWRPYNGPSPHDHHVHISVFDDTEPWKIK